MQKNTGKTHFKKGHKPWNTGLKCWNKNYQNAGFQKGHKVLGGIKTRFTSDRVLGEKNINWKGDEVSYTHIHTWINRHKEKKECEFCGAIYNLDMANISGEYKRDVNDWKVLCRKCHARYDNKKQNHKCKVQEVMQ